MLHLRVLEQYTNTTQITEIGAGVDLHNFKYFVVRVFKTKITNYPNSRHTHNASPYEIG